MFLSRFFGPLFLAFFSTGFAKFSPNFRKISIHCTKAGTFLASTQSPTIRQTTQSQNTFGKAFRRRLEKLFGDIWESFPETSGKAFRKRPEKLSGDVWRSFPETSGEAFRKRLEKLSFPESFPETSGEAFRRRLGNLSGDVWKSFPETSGEAFRRLWKRFGCSAGGRVFFFI